MNDNKDYKTNLLPAMTCLNSEECHELKSREYCKYLNKNTQVIVFRLSMVFLYLFIDLYIVFIRVVVLVEQLHTKKQTSTSHFN